jgi:hypothetical protein
MKNGMAQWLAHKTIRISLKIKHKNYIEPGLCMSKANTA